MRLNRFFGNFDFSGDLIRSFDRDFINQLKNVLRLKNGDEILLCDGKLNEALCFIENINRDEAVLKIIKIEKNKKEFNQEVILYCSVLKRENFELVVQKATELGVKKIVPVIASRTIKLGFKRDRLEKIIKEASEQSGRGILPILSDPVGFKDAVDDADSNDLNLFFEPGGKPFDKLKLDLKTPRQAQVKIGVFIGPEGGWNEEELKIENYKFKIVGLSPFILRAETAAMAALAQLSQLIQ
jgi:16S rRNA (uracil1498-N3)-methyltransferase